MSKADTSCVNCGICCKKGGPALHIKDAFLFEEKVLHVHDVVTIRTGELVRDDMKNRLVAIPNELIKIAPSADARPDDWTCRFLTSNKRCFIHGTHPAECRAFYCKEPEALMQLTHEERLDREKVCKLTNAPEWWIELINTHEEQVAYGKLAEWAIKIDEDKECRAKFIEAVEYDRSFRELVIEKEAAPKEALNFLFGRPLMHTMIMFGLQARQSGDNIHVVKMVD